MSDTPLTHATDEIDKTLADRLSGNDRLTGDDTDNVLRGFGGNDAIRGRGGNDLLQGDEGNDRLFAGDGDDTLDGGTGNDVLSGGGGADELFGGDGDDTLRVDAQDLIIDGGAGNDHLCVQGEDGVVVDQAASSIERVSGGIGDDVFDGSGLLEATIQNGRAGDDTLIGGAGSDRQTGGEGDDLIQGGDGADNQRAGAGDDTLEGGSGADSLRGGAGEDLLEGGDGNDGLSGDSGNDILRGGAGDDRLNGGTGDDVLEGGTGDDTLSGGAGADVFILGEDGGSDFIKDFQDGIDRIEFDIADGTFDDLQFIENRAGTIVRLGEAEVQLRKISSDQLDAADFSFTGAPSSDFPFPEPFGVVDVADFGIIADDGVDDTAAIQALFDAFQTRVTYYFRDGIYDISDTLTPPNGVGVPVPNFITIQGESEEGTIFKLADDLDHQGAILDYGAGVAQGFNNRILDVTFDIGTGNTNAVGLSFVGNNQSSISDVTIRSGEGGALGLNLTTGETGPMLVEDVTIERFALGIDNRNQGNSVTLENVVLRGQEVGINNGRADGLFARQIDYEGPGIGLINADQSSRAVIIDSSFRSTSEAADQTAIINTRFLYAENIVTEGFAQAVDAQLLQNFGNGDIEGDLIEEYFGTGDQAARRGGADSLFDSPDTRIGLEMKETPEPPLDPDLGNWASPLDFGGVAGVDASAALQAAIDSGATTIYIPAAEERWMFESEIIIRGNVERVIGSDAGRLGGGTQFRIADGAPNTVIMEGVNASFTPAPTAFIHDSDRTLVLRDITKANYEAVAEGDQGDVFFANFIGDAIQLNDQKAYGRHINLEGDNAILGQEAKIINDGAEFVVLGLKTEDPGTVLKTIGGGISEVLGSWHNGQFDATIPRFVTEDASLFAAGTTGATFATAFNLVEETRNGETRVGEIGVDGYSAYDASLIADRLIIVDNDDAVTTGDFASTTGIGGFLGDDFLFAAAGSDASIRYEAEALTSGTYEVSLRNINDEGGPAGRNQATDIDIFFGVAETTFDFEGLNMDATVEQYTTLDTVDASAGDTLFVAFGAENADGTVIADAVRFELIGNGAQAQDEWA
ncbi:MAG: glycosyl hydrolase family 28-related protein [Pseudomonadota bacterium]